MIVRLKNRQIILGKESGPKGEPIINVTFITAIPWQKEIVTDKWLRSQSKFNVAVNHFSMSEQSLSHIFQMMGIYQSKFEVQPEKVITPVERPKIIIPT